MDQAAALMGVSARHTRRILAAYRKEGVAALAHGHRGRRPPNATPEATRAEVLHLPSTRYCGTNHTHLSELLGEREGIDIDRSTLRRHTGFRRVEQPAPSPSAQASGSSPADAAGGDADPDGRQLSPMAGGGGTAVRAAAGGGMTLPALWSTPCSASTKTASTTSC